MANYSIIADTSQKLVEILQNKLVPDIIQNPNEIGLRSPEERGDVALGIFLYDIKESEEVRQQGAVLQKERLRKPPVYLNLFYMLTAYSSGDLKYRMVQEQRIIGGIIQAFHDYPMIPLEEVDKEKQSGMDLRIQMEQMTLDEKSKIWSFPNTGNRLSVFYKVSPIAIDSALSTKIHRVTDIDINITAETNRRKSR